MSLFNGETPIGDSSSSKVVGVDYAGDGEIVVFEQPTMMKSSNNQMSAHFFRFDAASSRWVKQSKVITIEHTPTSTASKSTASTSKGVSLQKRSKSTQRSSSSSNLVNDNGELRYLTSRFTFDTATALYVWFLLR